MSEDKDRFLAKYANIDVDKEFSPENPNPNVHAIRRPEVTRKHALMLLNHPNEDVAAFALSMTNQKTRLVKRSDLENYSGNSEQVKKQIAALFKYEGMCKVAPKSARMAFKPFYPEDKE
jgi:hypothetical protein